MNVRRCPCQGCRLQSNSYDIETGEEYRTEIRRQSFRASTTVANR